jgi:hypothetical protein
MFVRTLTAATLSLAVFASGAAFASSSFDSLLAETKTAALAVTAVQAERSDRDLANSYIVMAESLAKQGDEAKALSLLTFARGKLGLSRQERLAAQ